jgi:tetratricopeptide (TPR) repeat protein
MLLASIALQLILPTNIVILIVQAVLIVAIIAGQHGNLPILRFQALTMSMENQANNFHIPTQKVSFPIYFTAGLLSILLLVSSYFVGRAYAASALFFQAGQAGRDNDVVKLYEKQQMAVQTNPYLDIYRRQYAITNMVIASSLASKTDITEAEKTQVAELLQQAVREARSASLLDPLDVENAAVLAQIYQNMIGAADQADQFAVQAYLQAIQNDPTNPALRISLGGMMLNQKQFEQAAGIFRQTVDIKPDYPNTYYNLAFALKQIGSYEDARLSYQTLLKLVDPASEDYTKVTAELEEVEKMIAEEEAKKPKTTSDSKSTPAAASTTKTTPSIIDQNLVEDPSEVISNPSDASLTTTPGKTNLGTQIESTPAPTPAL